ncbi:MAG TPA: hypothetical protein VGI61_13810 [Parafilimonas sp.]|jgi:hypothetical protein
MAIIPELSILRKNIKANQSTIIKEIKNEYYNLNGNRRLFCMFCDSKTSLTKEHVLPRWVFEKNPNRDFITSINGSRKTYNTTTIPACINCNGLLLNSLEKTIIKSLSEIDLKNSFFTNEELQNIIRWLEIIDYKFQVTGFIRKFIKSDQIPYNNYLSKIPLSLYRTDLDSDRKILAELRYTLKRIGIKSKLQNINSLVIFKSKNKNFHFFHSFNKVIFLEFPKYNIAMLYFYNRIFNSNKEAYGEAMKLIKEVY